ncbi:glycosyltransferase [Actomonas aquatica]|uniref:Glycosyltransferase n=1 Tax=Actomonas aquatica TaxID=2866162 RepID=A0ABZ1CAN9_9BACT|nr:glycosyltransferase [Opitutus sp. WL0086]WRQ88457.1 glycosyltransferase [Opitutus sp. WL0086]
MKILFLSDFHLGGGAAIAATRLAKAFSSAGHEIVRVVGRRESDDPTIVQEFARHDSTLDRLRRRVGLLPPTTYRSLPDATIADINAEKPDWISVHNLHGYGLRLDFFEKLDAPILWTLHDMWSFTGRCAYNGDCVRYQTNCGHDCPTPTEYPALAPSLIPQAHAEKTAMLRTHPHLHAVTPSNWLRQHAVTSGWPSNRVTTVRYTLDLDVLKPVSTSAARVALGIEPSAFVVGFGAMNPGDVRKGGPVLTAAFDSGLAAEATLLSIGSRPLPLRRSSDYLHLGTINSDVLLATFYSACDVFLHLSQQDNLPNMVNESLACGTPVIATPESGAAEVIEHGVSGLILDRVDQHSLSAALAHFQHGAGAHGAWRAAARRRAETVFDAATVVREYMDLANHLMAQ